MKKNMGFADRFVRIAFTIVVVLLYAFGKISGLLAIILGILALVFAVTSLAGFCPLYIPLRLSTRKGEPSGSSTKP